MDPTFETTIKQEIPELPDGPPTDNNDLNSDPAEVELKPPLDVKFLRPSHEIGSKNSAFQPYKQLTILTNLQRGNVKTLCRDAAPVHPLTFQEKAAKGCLKESEVNDSNVNSVDIEGLTALMWASFHSQLGIVEMLITKGADVNLTGPDGQTPLMFAAAKGNIDTFNYLLACGAELETEDEFGNTALIHAVHYNQTECVKELLMHGASMTKCNFIGDNAFEVAFKKGNRATQYALEMHLKKILETHIAE